MPLRGEARKSPSLSRRITSSEEDYQGGGLASALLHTWSLQHMVGIALTRSHGTFLWVRVVRQSGLPVTLTREGDGVHGVLSFPPCGAFPQMSISDEHCRVSDR
jgi:hypothetical protein